MDYAFFTLEERDGVGYVTINRPPANAMSIEFVQELDRLMDEIRDDSAVRSVLFRSAIGKYFMAGMDLKSMPAGMEFGDLDASMGPKEVMRQVLAGVSERLEGDFKALQSSISKVEALPKPTIAAINGHALGGGLEFSLACDFRIMARGAGTVGLTEVNLGFLPAAGGTQRLTRLLGRGKAIEMILLGKRLSADEACEIGLVHKAVEPEDLDAESERLALELAHRATLAIGRVKQCIYGGEDLPLAEGLALENRCLAELLHSEDMVEGISSFIAGLKPQYKGR
jgi:enoyl-CoA hydratase/carnithine racemase